MAIDITPETRIKGRADLLSSSLSDTEAVMMDIDKGKYYGVEDVGRLIWDYIGEVRRVADVCEYVSVHFDVDPIVAQNDTVEFINQLAAEGLVELDASGSVGK